MGSCGAGREHTFHSRGSAKADGQLNGQSLTGARPAFLGATIFVRFSRPRLPLLAGVAVSIATNLNAISSTIYAADLLAVCAYLTPSVGRVDSTFAQDDAAIKKLSHRSLREGMFDLT